MFKFGSNLTNPDTRHPRYGYSKYRGNGDYMSNAFMGALYSDKQKQDPSHPLLFLSPNDRQYKGCQ